MCFRPHPFAGPRDCLWWGCSLASVVDVVPRAGAPVPCCKHFALFLFFCGNCLDFFFTRGGGGDAPPPPTFFFSLAEWMSVRFRSLKVAKRAATATTDDDDDGRGLTMTTTAED